MSCCLRSSTCGSCCRRSSKTGPSTSSASFPKRYDSTLLQIYFPGGTGAKVWTFVTYSLLHANLSHIGFNILWLLPFGSALARRFGAPGSSSSWR